MNQKEPKIAIVHDHLGFGGGGERTMLILALELGADFITAYALPGTFPEYQKKLGPKLITLTDKVVNTRVIRFFWLRRLYLKNREIFQDYDILIASSQAATEAVAHYSRKNAVRIVYTHTTPRRVFDMYEISKKGYPLIIQPAYALFARYWKHRYLNAIRKFNVNIANSENVRQRVKDHTGGDVNAVIWPPILTDKFKSLGDGDYYLSFGRVDEAKRIEVIIEAFKKMPDKELVVASGGPRLEKVKELANGAKNIRILGWVSDEELISLVGNCLATVYIPISEDAGMTHLESNVAGKPYLGVAEGGLIESTIDGQTGILLAPDPKADDVIGGIRTMTKTWCLERKEICQKHARKYDQKIFVEKIKSLLRENDPRMPILGIDASRWENPQFPGQEVRTGVEVYAKNLIENIVQLYEGRGLRIRLYASRAISSLPLSRQKIIPPGRRWTAKWLSQEMAFSPVDYFLTPSYYIPKNGPSKSYAVIHDVIFRTSPEKYSFKERVIQNIVTKINIRRSRKIFTVSENSKKEIMREYSLDSGKIMAVPMGYDRKIEENALGKENEESREKSILFIGRIEKKKSVDVLIKAFADFSKSHNDWRLLLVGKDGFGIDGIKTLIESLGMESRIELTGYVSEKDKWQLLAKAGVIVHPSSHEGSAIPILEAWDAGAVVVAADAPIMKEIGQDAVLYFKSGDPMDLSEKIGMIINDKAGQDLLVALGRKYLDKYSWKKTASVILEEITNC